MDSTPVTIDEVQPNGTSSSPEPNLFAGADYKRADSPRPPSVTHSNFAWDDLEDLARRVSLEIDFDNGRGDIRLIVKSDGPGKNELQAFMVCSAMMVRASKSWERMLTGRLVDGQPGHTRIFDFTEDNCVALEVFMNVIHLRFDQIPESLELDTLAELAILTDKYMATALMAPWINSWLSRVEETISSPGNEPHWLWISWEYGLPDVFNQVGHRLSMALALAPPRDCPSPISIRDGRDMESSGVSSARKKEDVQAWDQLFQGATYDGQESRLIRVDSSSFPVLLPPGVEETIRARRQEITTKMLDLIYGYFKKLRFFAGSGMVTSCDDMASNICQFQRSDCYRLQLGSLFAGLGSRGLWPEKEPTDIDMSPNQLQSSLTGIQLSDCNNNAFNGFNSDFGGPSCGSFGKVIEQVGGLSFETNDFHTYLQEKHMKTQRRKARISWTPPKA